MYTVFTSPTMKRRSLHSSSLLVVQEIPLFHTSLNLNCDATGGEFLQVTRGLYVYP